MSAPSVDPRLYRFPLTEARLSGNEIRETVIGELAIYPSGMITAETDGQPPMAFFPGHADRERMIEALIGLRDPDEYIWPPRSAQASDEQERQAPRAPDVEPVVARVEPVIEGPGHMQGTPLVSGVGERIVSPDLSEGEEAHGGIVANVPPAPDELADDGEPIFVDAEVVEDETNEQPDPETAAEAYPRTTLDGRAGKTVITLRQNGEEDYTILLNDVDQETQLLEHWAGALVAECGLGKLRVHSDGTAGWESAATKRTVGIIEIEPFSHPGERGSLLEQWNLRRSTSDTRPLHND